MSILISANNISKKYPIIDTAGNRLRSLVSLLFSKNISNGVSVLKNINLQVMKGESVAIIGKNGAGKSTLLKIISGMISPTTGEVNVNGKIGALLELGSGFHPEYTGKENLKMASALAGMSSKDFDDKLKKMIEFADIGEYINQPVKTYSSGMVVRLGFSIITVTSPELLITDEVLAVGDADFQRKCIKWIDTYIKKGGTLLLVSHSIYHVQKLCSKAIWLENGTIKKQGGSFDISQEYTSFYEKKIGDVTISGEKDISNYHLQEITLLNTKKDKITAIEKGKDLSVKVVIYTPDGRVPGLALGIVRKDIPVYGTISDSHNPNVKKISDKYYQYTIKFPQIKLLPADYKIKAHAMDPECLRLMDEMESPLRVHSNSTDMGVVELECEWF